MSATHRQVLDEFLAQVVVDAVHLVFGQRLVQLLAQLVERLAVLAEGLLHDDARPPLPGAGGLGGAAGYVREDAGGDGEVEDAIPPLVLCGHGRS